MAIDKSEFQIHISTSADTAGLEKTIDSHKGLRELFLLLDHGAGEAFVALAELAGFMANPYNFAFSGATLATSLLVEQLEKVHQQLRQPIEISHDTDAATRAPGADEAALRPALRDVEQRQRLQNGRLNQEQTQRLTLALEKLAGLLENPEAVAGPRAAAEGLRRQIGADEAAGALVAGREHLRNLRDSLAGPASPAQMAEMVALLHQLADVQLLNSGTNNLNEQLQDLKHKVEILMQQHAINNGATHL
jgi:hypothetical protein